MAKTLLSITDGILRIGEIEEALKNNPQITDLMSQKLKEATELPIVYDSFFDNGQMQTVFYCHNCGKSWIKNGEYYSRRYWYGSYDSSVECPSCKKKHPSVACNHQANSLGFFSYVREVNMDEGYAYIDSFEICIRHDNSSVPEEKRFYDGHNIEFLKKDLVAKIYSICESFVSLKYGVKPSCRLSNARTESSVLAANHSCFNDAVTKLVNTQFVENDNLVKLITLLSPNDKNKGIGKAISDFNMEYLASKEEKKLLSKKTQATDITEYKFDAVPVEVVKEKLLNSELIVDDSKKAITLLYSSLGNTNKYMSLCLCGHVFDNIASGYIPNNEYVECPNCGRKISLYYARKYNSHKISFPVIKYEMVDNMIVVRSFDFTMRFDIERNASFTLSETMRIFYSEKNIKVVTIFNEKLTKGRVTDLDYAHRSRDNYVLLNTKEELKELFENSFLKHSGAIEALGLENDDLKIDYLSNISRSSYIYTWIKNKCIEQILKTGLKNLAVHIMNDPNILEKFNAKGTTIYEILNITKPVFKIAKARNADQYELAQIKKIMSLEQSLTIEEYQNIKESDRTDLIIDIREKYGIPFKKIIEYVKSCYDHQCILNNEALVIWSDYLKMAKDMEYRLKDNTIKFPASLKKEHDRAVFAYRVVQDQVNHKKFVEAAKINDKLYSYSYKDFMIIVPQTPNDVIQEGTVQKHCVASYVSRIRDQETAVCFARKKEDPETAYFTIEVRDGSVVQVRGYCNCAPKDEDFLEFLNKWATAKSLKLRY